jgi:hypothetical protein
MQCEVEIKHDDQHALLRIFDNVPEGEAAATTDAERYYNRAKTVFAEELGALEAKLNQRMEGMLATKVDQVQQAFVTGPPAIQTSTTLASAGDKGQGEVGNDELSAISLRMDNLETDVATRFACLEGMLRRVLEAVEERR